jgi:hypothetical protein
MKIVQSLWSEPAKKYGGYLRYHGRWPHPRLFWYSWVISTAWAHKHYGVVELVTDNEGARWLVDKLKLPFTSVRTDLENLGVRGELWAYGKIVAYATQQEPFFHIDGDVYLDGRLPQRYEKADLVCQLFEQADNLDGFERIYDENVRLMEKSLPSLPSFWPFMTERCAGNCGIFGGSNVAAIQKYTADVKALVTNPINAPGWAGMTFNNAMSCVIEQQALWCSAREQGIPLTPIFENSDFEDPEVFKQKALETHFNHAAVEGKNPVFGTELGKIVERDYPTQYKIINDLYPRTFMDLAMPTVLQRDASEQSIPDATISRVEVVHLPPQPKKD